MQPDPRAVIGDLILQLISAQHKIAALTEKLKELQPNYGADEKDP